MLNKKPNNVFIISSSSAPQKPFWERYNILGVLENHSSFRIESAAAKLVMKVDCVAGLQKATFTKVICDVTCAIYVDPHVVVRINKTLVLPPLAPSTPPQECSKSADDAQQLINVSYEIA